MDAKLCILLAAALCVAAAGAHAQFTSSNLPVVQIQAPNALSRSPKVAGTVTIRVRGAGRRG